MMRSWRKFAGSYFVLVIGLLAISNLSGATPDRCGSTSSLDGLLERWAKRDGVAFIEVGHEMSECFVSQPRQFLQVMSRNPEAWLSWLEGLPVHTLTAFREGARAECEALQKQMMTAAESLTSDPALGQEAKALLSELRRTAVREID